MKYNLIALVFMMMAPAFAAPTSLYGTDDRKDVYEVSNPLYLKWAKSTAAMINNERIGSVNQTLSFVENDDITYTKSACPDSKFIKQPAAASCTGFLISEDVVLTAGHCAKVDLACEDYRWVFDFQLDHANSVSDSKTRMDAYRIDVQKSSIYSCKKILTSVMKRGGNRDYALIQLDRKVTDREPLKLRREGKVKESTPLVVIGHPTGLPTKIADNAVVKATSRNSFWANLDTFHGNSGSPVFNVETGEVEGILVAGDKDFFLDKARNCMALQVYSDHNAMFETVTKITMVKELEDLLSGKLR